MYLPPIESYAAKTQTRIIDFKGYNDSPVIEDGEMRDMLNLSSEKYPNLFQRKLRNTYKDEFENPVSILQRKEKLAVVDIKTVTVDDVPTEFGVFYYGTTEENGKTVAKRIWGLDLIPDEKIMVAINTRIVILPDKKWFNTETEQYGNLDCTVEPGEGISVTFGTNNITFSGTGTPFAGFNVGDAVTIEGCTSIIANNISAIIKAIDGVVLTFPDNSFTAGSETGDVKISRVSPDMDFILESNNRLWACKGSSIYASKLGDPLNWNVFQGLLNDSYAVDVGTDGDFTGCVSYASHLLFFKEDYIHKIYGNKPSNYNLVDAECYSLEKGSHKSIKVINEVVFYKSRLGIMAYTGGSPELISNNFGTKRYGITVSGSDGIKYYASMKYGNTYDLMVYDLDKNLWHKEDHTQAKAFAYINGELVFIDAATKKIISINPLTADESDRIEWMGVFGFDEYHENKKIYSKIKMRLEMEAETELTISIQMDDMEWIKVWHGYAETNKSVYIPIIPQRCQKFSIKLEGVGFCTIKSLVREFSLGSER